jgi:ribonucleotide reductase alpha subunit
LISRAALRGAFVDQSQSLNIRLHDNSNKYLRAVFVHGWKCGHKTGSYYIRTKPAASAMKTTVAEMAAAVMPEYRPDDKINVTVERVSVDGGVLAHTEHTFHLLLPFCADDDDDDDELCTAIVPGEIFVREIAAAPPTQSRYSQFQRFEDTPRFKMADGDGCLACGS